jgi:hypothetical protein
LGLGFRLASTRSPEAGAASARSTDTPRSTSSTVRTRAVASTIVTAGLAEGLGAAVTLAIGAVGAGVGLGTTLATGDGGGAAGSVSGPWGSGSAGAALGAGATATGVGEALGGGASTSTLSSRTTTALPSVSKRTRVSRASTSVTRLSCSDSCASWRASIFLSSPAPTSRSDATPTSLLPDHSTTTRNGSWSVRVVKSGRREPTRRTTISPAAESSTATRVSLDQRSASSSALAGSTTKARARTSARCTARA